MATKKNGLGARFMHWYESYSGKNVVNAVYSIGASVVIVGALFKIMHWPGAGIVLTAGMITEAFLFVIGVLEHPHPEFHWENVFPQLLEHGTNPALLAEKANQPRPTLLGSGETGASQKGASLSEQDMNALNEGIKGLAKTASQLSELGKVATAGVKLGEKMEEATEATSKFAATAQTLGAKNDELAATYATIATDMQNVVAGTKTYQQNVENIGAKVSSINSVYELQLVALQAQVDAYKAQAAKVNAMTADVEKMQVTTAEALKNSEAYNEGAKKLASQVANLNQVYGNMLGALV